MLVTSGDIFYAIIGLGVVGAVLGIALLSGNSRPVRLLGVALFAFGICAILLPTSGITSGFTRSIGLR